MNIFINKKKWATFSPQEMEDYRDEVFRFYRARGFPYFPTDKNWREKEFEKLSKFDFTRCIDQKNKVIKQTMHGLSLCWSYFPHHYEVQCNNMKTPKQAFDDDATFRNVIRKRTIMGDNISDNGIRKMLKIYTGVQSVSNFRPTAAAAIYHHFSKGSVVYDMSSGFGGRLLGSHLIRGQSYHGVDPSTKTFEGLSKMILDFGINAEIKKQGSELPSGLPQNSVDLCFTSPPYFDCEKYSDEQTQSYLKYPNKNSWMNGFLKSTLENCLDILKKDGKLLLNVQNVKSYPNLVQDATLIARQVGFNLVDTWGFQLSAIGGGHKTEPILIFDRK